MKEALIDEYRFWQLNANTLVCTGNNVATVRIRGAEIGCVGLTQRRTSTKSLTCPEKAG